MKLKLFFFTALVLILLAGCGGECKTDNDCQKPHFFGKCEDKICVYTPIANECGNGVCESDENKCTCPADCGICQGSNGPYLKFQCLNNKCVDSVPLEMINPVYLSSESTVSGIVFKTTSDFNNPFNLKKDLFKLKFSLMKLPSTIDDIVLKRIELTGVTDDRRTVSLFDKSINRPLYLQADVFKELILDLRTAETNGKLSNLALKVYFDYSVVSSSKKTVKSGVFQSRFAGLKNFIWVMPSSQYSCPESCDDNNPGTEDICGPETNFFCVHKPISGECGNLVCDAGENKCTCPVDCGPCSGSAGNYMIFTCKDKECVAQLKPSFVQDKKTIFDDRDLSFFHLQNNFEYNDPFNINADEIKLTFSLFDKNEDITEIKITDIRLFEGTIEVAHVSPSLSLAETSSSVSALIKLPSISRLEDDMSLNLAVWYEYYKGDQVTKNDFRKSLGKITLVNPGI